MDSADLTRYWFESSDSINTFNISARYDDYKKVLTQNVQMITHQNK